MVALQKRQVHQEWIRLALSTRCIERILKTDLFEEAYGLDRIWDDIIPGARHSFAIDLDESTVRIAARRFDSYRAMVCDIRQVAIRDHAIDAVVSTSTLDHFSSVSEITRSLDEIARILRPGGVLAISLDNPRNPSYWFLRPAVRVMAYFRWMTFALGETTSLERLTQMLTERGFLIQSRTYLIHNPRGFSTILFLALRKSLGRFADRPIAALLTLFAAVGRLPSRSITGCFLGIVAVKES